MNAYSLNQSQLQKLIAEAEDPDNVGFAVEDALQEVIDENQDSTQVVRKDEEDERLPRLFF